MENRTSSGLRKIRENQASRANANAASETIPQATQGRNPSSLRTGHKHTDLTCLILKHSSRRGSGPRKQTLPGAPGAVLQPARHSPMVPSHALWLGFGGGQKALFCILALLKDSKWGASGSSLARPPYWALQQQRSLAPAAPRRLHTAPGLTARVTPTLNQLHSTKMCSGRHSLSGSRWS